MEEKEQREPAPLEAFAKDGPFAADFAAISNEQLENWFTYHDPAEEPGDPALVMSLLRLQARFLAASIRNHCPPSADTTTAIRQVRAAVMWANSAIMNRGL